MTLRWGVARGAAIALGGRVWLARRLSGPAWHAHNHAGRGVDLVNGPAWTIAVVATSLIPVGRAEAFRQGLGMVVGVGGSAVIGRIDDRYGSHPAQAEMKGLRGHLGALRHGTLSTGAVKLVALPILGCAASRIRRQSGQTSTLIDSALIAATANFLNLLDRQPGRALKVLLAVAAPGMLSASARRQPAFLAGLGAAAAILPSDLGERAMLGDCGANALGAFLGVQAIALPRWARCVALAAVTSATLYSEHTSFSDLIDRTPALRLIDRIGRVEAP